MVFNSKNEDCLSEKSTTKDSIVKYFSDGIKKVKIHDENDKFFKEYWKMRAEKN